METGPATVMTSFCVQFEKWGCGLLWEAFRVKREWAVGCWPTFQTACKMMSTFPSRSNIGSSKARKTKKREEADLKNYNKVMSLLETETG